jgi:hypothetical protein
MSLAKRMIPAEFQYLKHLAVDGRDLYAKGIKSAYLEAMLTLAGGNFTTMAQIVAEINAIGIPNVTASTAGGALVLTTNATGATEAIELLPSGTANAALGFSTVNPTIGTGTSGPTAGVITGSVVTLPVNLFGLTLNYISTHLGVATSGSITLGSNGPITVNGQVVDSMGSLIEGVQDVTADTFSTTGANITALGSPVGVIKTGSGTVKVWMQTNAFGAFGFTVTDATAGELGLLKVAVPDSLVAMAELQY